MVPEELIGDLGDTHLYSNHVDQAMEQISREPYELPKLVIDENIKWKEGGYMGIYTVNDLQIIDYNSHPTIKAKLSN